MTAPTPTYEAPSVIAAGDTLAFYVAGGATPADDGWTGTATLYGPATAAATVTAYGADFLVTFPASVTAAAGAGDYRFAVMATKATARHTIATGSVRLAVNPGTVATSGGLEHCQRTLTVINAAIEGRLTADMESYSVAGRSITKISIAELVKLQGVYTAKVRTLQNAGKPRPSFQVQFTPTGRGVA